VSSSQVKSLGFFGRHEETGSTARLAAGQDAAEGDQSGEGGREEEEEEESSSSELGFRSDRAAKTNRRAADSSPRGPIGDRRSDRLQPPSCPSPPPDST